MCVLGGKVSSDTSSGMLLTLRNRYAPSIIAYILVPTWISFLHFYVVFRICTADMRVNMWKYFIWGLE